MPQLVASNLYSPLTLLVIHSGTACSKCSHQMRWCRSRITWIWCRCSRTVRRLPSSADMPLRFTVSICGPWSNRVGWWLSYLWFLVEFDEKDEKERLTPYDIYSLIIRLIGSEHKEEIKKADMKLLVEKVLGFFKLDLWNKGNFLFMCYFLLWGKIFEEADIDKNGEITLDEFEHVVLKSPEFPMWYLLSFYLIFISAWGSKFQKLVFVVLYERILNINSICLIEQR